MLQSLLDELIHYGWGQCMLAHMYHEMHEITYKEAKSMEVGVYVTQVWAWKYLSILQLIYEDLR